VPSLDFIGSVVQLVGSVDLPLAHVVGYPHAEPPPQQSSGGGGASPAVIGAGVVSTLGIAGALIWVRGRTLRAEESAALERDASAEAHEQGPGPAVEPGDHPRPREEPA
jgi:hypothetical protein